MKRAVASALLALAIGCGGPGAHDASSSASAATNVDGGTPEERAAFAKRLADLPSSTKHPGKRPWSRGDVEERLDAMKKQPSLVAMGKYAFDRGEEPIDMSDPASAVGGGPEAGLGTFNDGAMLLLLGGVHAKASAAKAEADVHALYTDIATMPLPSFSNSGGPTDGREQRERLVSELRASLPPSLLPALEGATTKTPFRSNRDRPQQSP